MKNRHSVIPGFSTPIARLFSICTLFLLHLAGYTLSAQKPSISSFQPAIGPVATPITIYGTNFNSVARNNTVYVGGVKAVVTSATSTTLTVVAPAGVAYRPISVTTNGLTAYSSTPFVISFTGGNTVLTSSSMSSRTDAFFSRYLSAAGVADLDGDGKGDLVVVGVTSNMISVLKNTSMFGASSFSYRTDYAVGAHPASLTFGDLDGDGKQDVLVINQTANTVSVFRNSSAADSISLQPRIDIATDSMPLHCFIQDLDNDGKPDLLCTNSAAGTVSVFRNTSAGNIISFAAKASYATGKDPAGVVAADLNGDGLPEMAVANSSSATVSVFKNKSTPGNILFDVKIDYPDASLPSVLLAGDLDGDGKMDLVAASRESAFFSVLKNNGVNGTISFAPAVSFATGFGPSSTISLGDMNGDGKVDVAVNHENYSTFSLIKNESRPDTLSFATKVDYTTHSTVAATIQADVDGDGRPDVITANDFGGTVSTFRNTATRPFVASVYPTSGGNGEVVTVSGYNFSGATAVRFGGVPATSFLVTSPTTITAVVDSGASGEVTVVTPYGAMTLYAAFTFSRVPIIKSFTPATGSTGTLITLNGANFTGVTSVTIGGIPATSFSVLSPTALTATAGSLAPGSYEVKVTNAAGTGTLPGFYTGVTVSGFYPTSGPAGTHVTIQGTHFSSVASANTVYFGPVRASVVAATVTTLSVVAPPGTSYQPITVTTDSLTSNSSRSFMETFKGTGNEFTPASFSYVLDSSVGRLPGYASISDLNNDGKPDVVIPNYDPSSLSVCQNSGSAARLSFRGRVDYPVGEFAFSTSTGDLDGDGRPDVVVLTRPLGVNYDRSITVFRNTTVGDSIQLSPAVYPIGSLVSDPSYSLISDFDSDGKPDVAILSYGYVSILKNTSRPGAISFAPKIDFFSSTLGNWLRSTDVDGDGKTDLVVFDNDYNSINFLRNVSGKGTVVFAPAVKIGTESNQARFAMGDFDNDGLDDIAATDFAGNEVYVYKNTSTAGSISFNTRTSFPLNIKPAQMEVSDMDGDGRLDIALATTDHTSVTVMKNTGTAGSIRFGSPIEFKSPFNLGSVFIADLNVDGKPDFLTVNRFFNSYSAFVNQCADDGLPVAAIDATGPTEVCAGDSVVLKTGRVNGAVYQWYKDGVAVANAKDSVFNAHLAGRYGVQVSVNGTISSSAPVNVSIKAVPAPPTIASQGGNVFCQGSAIILISSAKAGNQWYKDNMVLTGSVDTLLRVTGVGTYKVQVSGNGCTVSSVNAVTTTIKTIPPPALVTAPVSSFCSGDSMVLSAGAGAGLPYQWTLYEEPVPGAFSPALTIKIPGRYSVITSANGCYTSSSPVTITSNPTPAKPVISPNGIELLSSSPDGNQWYRNGTAIPGATYRGYTPFIAGNYSVQVTLNGCQGPFSDIYALVMTGIINIDNTHFIRLSPNPVRSQLKLDFNLNLAGSLTMDLVDMNGRVIQRWTDLKNGATLHVASLPGAVYLARIYSKAQKKVYTLKVLKL